MKLSEAPQVDSINSEYITLMDANGSPLKINKADLAEVIRNNMPVATTDKNGLYGKSYVAKVFATSSTNTKLIKLFSCKKSRFSGKISLLFRRSESGVISEFSIYSNAYLTLERVSDIEIYRRAGNHSNIAFYRDEEYVYAYMPSSYYYLYCKLEFLFVGELILEVTEVDISTLTKIPLIE
nr:MAG TPA: hypothetical protein [Caudoviricetes sp.]